MAKKKKKAAKKVAKKTVSRAAAQVEASEAEMSSCTDQELVTAEVVTAGGHLMAGLATEIIREIEARGINVADLLHTAVANLQCSQMTARVSGEENADAGLDLARRRFIRDDFDEKPYLRVYGRVMEVLLNHRGFRTCTAGDVFHVFLVEIPDEIPEHYQQTPPPGQQVSLGRRTFNNRMARMCREELARPTVTLETGRDEDYVLTEDGQTLFDGWPPLSDIPGLNLYGPVTPENSARRQRRRRS